MKKLALLLSLFVAFSACNPSSKAEKDDDEKELHKKPHEDNEDENTDKTEGWSAADRDKVKAEWNRTFSGIKQKAQEGEDFDEAAFNRKSKAVISCTQKVLEARYNSYAAYKKGVQNGDMQKDPAFFNELGDCQQAFMDKYNNGNE